jgi:YHS domain-containing protein
MGWLIRILLVLLLVVLLVRAGWRLVLGVLEGATGEGRRQARSKRGSSHMVRDPVCGTFVVQSRALSAFSAGETAWFCSEACRRRWEAGHR